MLPGALRSLDERAHCVHAVAQRVHAQHLRLRKLLRSRSRSRAIKRSLLLGNLLLRHGRQPLGRVVARARGYLQPSRGGSVTNCWG